jgi:hypothetical protein
MLAPSPKSSGRLRPMLKRTLILLLISSLLQAQQLPGATNKQPCPDEKPIRIGLGVTIDQRHDLLRRGRSDDMVLVLCSPQLPYGGCGYQNHPPQKRNSSSLIQHRPSARHHIVVSQRSKIPAASARRTSSISTQERSSLAQAESSGQRTFRRPASARNFAI